MSSGRGRISSNQPNLPTGSKSPPWRKWSLLMASSILRVNQFDIVSFLVSLLVLSSRHVRRIPKCFQDRRHPFGIFLGSFWDPFAILGDTNQTLGNVAFLARFALLLSICSQFGAMERKQTAEMATGSRRQILVINIFKWQPLASGSFQNSCDH